MKKYDNISYKMNFTIAFMNVIYSIMIIYLFTQKFNIEIIIVIIGFTCILLMVNYTFFYLLDQFYITNYNEYLVVQKWFKKIKTIEFNNIKYIYFTGDLVILSEIMYKIPTGKINLKVRRKILKTLKKEVCIMISLNDKIFPKILLEKTVNAVKVDLGVKNKVYRNMFELD